LGVDGGFDGFVGFVKGLRAGLRLPSTLSDFGVPRDRAEEIVEKALVDPSCGGNPVELTKDNVTKLLDACFG
ncbi:MAG: iron-containing alcohol dehydrogenase, partial [Pseudomonadota bacterium]